MKKKKNMYHALIQNIIPQRSWDLSTKNDIYLHQIRDLIQTRNTCHAALIYSMSCKFILTMTWYFFTRMFFFFVSYVSCACSWMYRPWRINAYIFKFLYQEFKLKLCLLLIVQKKCSWIARTFSLNFHPLVCPVRVIILNNRGSGRQIHQANIWNTVN